MYVVLRASCVAFSPDGSLIASAGAEDYKAAGVAEEREHGEAVRVWDAMTGEEVIRLTNPGEDVSVLAFSPDGQRLLTVHGVNEIRLWDLTTGDELFILKGRFFSCVAFSPNAARIATGGDAIEIWNASNGARLRTLRGHNGRVLSIAFTPDGKRIVSGSKDQTVKLWEVDSGYETLTLDVGAEKHCHG